MEHVFVMILALNCQMAGALLVLLKHLKGLNLIVLLVLKIVINVLLLMTVLLANQHMCSIPLLKHVIIPLYQLKHLL